DLRGPKAVADWKERSALGVRLKCVETCEVIALAPGGPAAQAGIRLGARLVSLADSPVTSQRMFDDIVRSRPIGSAVAMTVVQDGQMSTMQLMTAAGASVYADEMAKEEDLPPAVQAPLFDGSGFVLATMYCMTWKQESPTAEVGLMLRNDSGEPIML